MLEIQKEGCLEYLIINFSSNNSWSSCMFDAPEKSQPKRFCNNNWKKKIETRSPFLEAVTCALH